MSIFYCKRCHAYCDSDQGAEEIGGQLVCGACADEISDAQVRAREEREASCPPSSS